MNGMRRGITMEARELLLWVIGMQHCTDGLPARSGKRDYLAGYSVQYCIEQNWDERTV